RAYLSARDPPGKNVFERGGRHARELLRANGCDVIGSIALRHGRGRASSDLCLELQDVSPQRYVETGIARGKHDLPTLIPDPSHDQRRRTVGRQEDKRAAVTRGRTKLCSLNLDRRARDRLP